MKQTLVVNRLKNPLDLIELSRKGLSRAAVDLVAHKIGLSDREMARIFLSVVKKSALDFT